MSGTMEHKSESTLADEIVPTCNALAEGGWRLISAFTNPRTNHLITLVFCRIIKPKTLYALPGESEVVEDPAIAAEAWAEHARALEEENKRLQKTDSATDTSNIPRPDIEGLLAKCKALDAARNRLDPALPNMESQQRRNEIMAEFQTERAAAFTEFLSAVDSDTIAALCHYALTLEKGGSMVADIRENNRLRDERDAALSRAKMAEAQEDANRNRLTAQRDAQSRLLHQSVDALSRLQGENERLREAVAKQAVNYDSDCNWCEENAVRAQALLADPKETETPDTKESGDDD